MLLLASYRLCRCRLAMGMLLLVDYRLCSFYVAKGIVLLESFKLYGCNALTSVCYHDHSLTFEVMEIWCNDNTRTSG